MRVSLFALLAAVLLVQTHTCLAYNILGIFHTPSKSHYITGGALLRHLAAAGHNVTSISPFPQKTALPNFRDIPILGADKALKELIPNMLNMTMNNNPYNAITEIFQMGFVLTNLTLRHPRMTEFLNDPGEQFDVVICEVFANEAMLGLGQHFNAPVIGFSTFGASLWTNDLVGNPSPLSYVPHSFLSFTDTMSFIERVGNTLMTAFERAIFYQNLPCQEQLYHDVFPGQNKPSMATIRRNVALVLLNQHFTTSTTRPYVPNMVEIGGIHVNRGPPNPLPQDMQAFVDGAKHGVVYFSMGSNIQSTQLPVEIRDGLLRSFGKLKQRVLWKWEDADLPGRPDNVLISSWFPQDDILAHPNVKVFITHGGLLSLTETVYHGLPIIGIPVFGDQSMNMARAENNGYALTVQYKNLSEASMSWALDEVMNNEKYSIKAKEISARYRDHPLPPLELAKFWVEYVVRHGGAPHLHSAGQDLPFVAYHSLDVFAFLGAAFAAIIYCVVWIFTKVLGFVIPAEKNEPTASKKKKKQ